MRIGGYVAMAALLVTSIFTAVPTRAAAPPPPSDPDVSCSSPEHPNIAERMERFARGAASAGVVPSRDGGPAYLPSFGFYDYVTNTECYFNLEQSFRTASVIKATILGTLLRRQEDISAEEAPVVEKMIVKSDDPSALELWHKLDCGVPGGKCAQVEKFLKDAGMFNTALHSTQAYGMTMTTAKDQIRLLRLFLDDGTFFSESRRQYAQGLLERANPRYGITHLQPPGTQAQVKPGYAPLHDEDGRFWNVNIIGHVYGGAQRYNYLMTMFSDNNMESLDMFNKWRRGGIRLDDMGELLTCGWREINGDRGCWPYRTSDCDYVPGATHVKACRTGAVRAKDGWVRVNFSVKPGSTFRWRVVDAISGNTVGQGTIVGNPGEDNAKTITGLDSSYYLDTETEDPFGPEYAAITNGEGGGGGEPYDQPPAVDAGPDRSGAEGESLSLRGYARDDHGDPAVRWTYAPVRDVDPGATCSFSEPAALATTFTCTDDGTYQVKLSADDGVNTPVDDTAVVQLSNVAPAFGGTAGLAAAPVITQPQPWQVFKVGRPVTLKAAYTDPGANDTHTCVAEWDDGSVEEWAGRQGMCTRAHTFTRAGMFTIRTKVTDDDSGSGEAKVMVVVYDPAAGQASGNGWLAGKAGVEGFTFHGGYPGGRDTVQGAATFRLTDAHLNAHHHIEWTVITPDRRVAIKGTGELTPSGREVGFVFYAHLENGQNRFRAVIWPKAAGDIPASELVYDNVQGGDYDLDLAQPAITTQSTMVIL